MFEPFLVVHVFNNKVGLTSEKKMFGKEKES